MSTEPRKDGAEAPREPFAAEYFVVIGEYSSWYVSTPMARLIEECLDAGAEWVKFVDLTGARIRLRTRMINYITQHSADQRAMERDFNRRIRENDGGENWDD
jgi:hypothetical protein